MLVWCMLIVACTIPCDGFMRLWFPSIAGPAYFARNPDVVWRDTTLKDVPAALVVSNDPKSLACEQYYTGRPEGGRFPWSQWLRPISRWLMLMVPFFLAVFFFFAILRKQWVERERLQFPLARVPLEFTRGCEAERWLPALFSNRAFLVGLGSAAAWRFVRALPLLFGADSGWSMTVPFKDVLQDTALRHLYLVNVNVWWSAIGFAYLVPADVSLSVWLFYLFGRTELQVAASYGSPLHYGGTWSDLMHWQMAGAYLVFTLGALYMARRHLVDVFKRAVGLAAKADDAAEPVSYRAAFWGLLISSALVVAWFHHYGMKLWVGAIMYLLTMSVMLVHARIVAQSGMYITQVNVPTYGILHGLGAGRVFGPQGAIVAVLHQEVFVNGSTALPSPPAIHAFRISEVFEKRRRLLLPAMVVSLLVAIIASSWTMLNMAYSEGAANFGDTWGEMDNPSSIFWTAHQMAQSPEQAFPARWLPFGVGIVLTAFVMFMRARFYWWPVHAIGLLAFSNWIMDRLWVPFLLGWLVKVSLMRFSTGRAVRQARFFFIGLIIEESFVGGVSTVVRTLTHGAVPGF